VSRAADAASERPRVFDPSPTQSFRRSDPGPTRPQSRASAVAAIPEAPAPAAPAAPAAAPATTTTPPPRPGPRYQLGEWLVRRGVLDRHQLFLALSTSHQLECRLGDAAIVMGFVQPALLEAEAEILESRHQAQRPHEEPRSHRHTRHPLRGAQRRMFAGYAWERGGVVTVELAR